jgi:hypothetical protein
MVPRSSPVVNGRDGARLEASRPVAPYAKPAARDGRKKPRTTSTGAKFGRRRGKPDDLPPRGDPNMRTTTVELRFGVLQDRELVRPFAAGTAVSQSGMQRIWPSDEPAATSGPRMRQERGCTRTVF